MTTTIATEPLNSIKDEQFDTAEEFIAAINPLNERWQPSPRDWVFRGQGDSTNPLVPVALRQCPPPIWGFGSDRHVGLFPTNKDQAEAEFQLVYMLAQSLDGQGIAFPGKDPLLRSRELRLFAYTEQHRKNISKFPPDQYLPLFALAQHHGIPTRLLDWSECAFTAAYFAAIHWMQPGRTKVHSGQLGVWGLQTKFLIERESLENIEVDLISAPLPASPNLQAQRGLFTIHRPYLVSDQPPPVKALDKLIESYVLKSPDWFENHDLILPVGRHLKLPASQSPRPLRLLSAYRIDGSSLFPGYDGAAQAVREAQQWEP